MKVYGIQNCNTVKRALDWLRKNNIQFEFHDFNRLGISTEKLKEWNEKAGYERFLNKQGLTWKQLEPAVKDNIKTGADALSLMQQKTSIIKRPVIEDGDILYFGFNEQLYTEQLLNKLPNQ